MAKLNSMLFSIMCAIFASLYAGKAALDGDYGLGAIALAILALAFRLDAEHHSSAKSCARSDASVAEL